jgi:hypothetical protein
VFGSLRFLKNTRDEIRNPSERTTPVCRTRRLQGRWWETGRSLPRRWGTKCSYWERAVSGFLFTQLHRKACHTYSGWQAWPPLRNGAFRPLPPSVKSGVPFTVVGRIQSTSGSSQLDSTLIFGSPPVYQEARVAISYCPL